MVHIPDFLQQFLRLRNLPVCVLLRDEEEIDLFPGFDFLGWHVFSRYEVVAAMKSLRLKIARCAGSGKRFISSTNMGQLGLTT